MRSIVPFLFGLLCGACGGLGSPAVVSSAPFSHVEAADDLRAKTVALVGRDDDDAPRVNCTGVWVSRTSILTAGHCVNQLKRGESAEYVVHQDVFLPVDLVPRDPVHTHRAALYVHDEAHDLALLRAGRDAPAHAVARTTLEGIRQGAFAQTMGHSSGLLWSYSSGDVSAIRRMSLDLDIVWIQTTAPISRGNSGCGLFDDRGRLMGIAHGVLRGAQLNIFVHGQYVDALLRKQGNSL